MSTAAQIAANRANAQLSTGPVTEAGRSRSCLNAVKTGLTGRTVLLPNEDGEQYTSLVAAFFDEHKPVGDEESALVQSLADTAWRTRRIPALEAAIYALGRLQFKDCFPQETDPEIRSHLIQAKIFLDYHRQLNNLAIQESRLLRQAEKDRKRLHELQENRRQQARQRLSTAAREYLKAVEAGNGPEFLDKTKAIGFEFPTEALLATAEALKANAAANRGRLTLPSAA